VLEVAIRAARAAGQMLLAAAECDIKVDRVEKRDIKLAADREAEAIILSALREAFPRHAILSEECGRTGGESDYLWIIDPLDGTYNFSRRIPVWCTSIALMARGEPVLGVIYDPTRNELYHAEKGKGAYCNGARIHVSDTAQLAEGVVALAVGLREGYEEPALRAARNVSLICRKARSFGSAAIDMSYVACGRLDGYFEFALRIWDVAAGITLAREAGGEVSLRHHSDIVVDMAVSNGRVHDALLREIGW
jgi:myo-inositol-1(or 4)-monophosphatase